MYVNISHRRRSRGTGGGLSPPNKNWGGTPSPLHVLVPKNTIANVFDNNFDISAHIFSPQTTQEFPKKHNEAGTPEQQPTDALSQIDYGHNGKLPVPTNNAKGILENLSRGMRMAEWKLSPLVSKRSAASVSVPD